MTVSIKGFLKAFFNEDENICFRVLPDKKWQDDFKGKKFNAVLDEVDNLLPQLEAHNREDHGIFFVVNYGGNEDKDIKRINAQFVEGDCLTQEEQLKRLKEFSIEPSILVKTRKSIHAYWLIKDGNIDDFRRIQSKLVKQFEGDPNCINESRVLRLPGFYHCKEEPVMVKCIKFNPELRYTQEELERSLPEMENIPNAIAEAPPVVNTRQKGIEIVCRQCLFIKHCQDNAAKLSEHDWYAMITNLAVFDGGRERIHQYSSPYPKYTKDETNRKIDKFFLSKTGPITCITINRKGYKCPRLPEGCGCNSPAALSFKPMDARELVMIAESLPVSESIVENTMNINNFIDSYMFSCDKTIANAVIEDTLKKRFTLKSTKDFKDYYRKAASQAKSEVQGIQTGSIQAGENLTDILQELQTAFLPGRPPISKVTDMVIEWFKAEGGQFYRNADDSCFMHYNNQLVLLGKDNPAFTSILYERGKINAVTFEGRCIIQAIRDFAYNHGIKIETVSWIHEKDMNIYVNLHNEMNEVLRISAGGIDTIQNGNNPYNIILLKGNIQPKPMVFDPAIGIKEGITAFKEYFIDNFACMEPERLLIGCYTVMMFLKNLVAAHPILKLSGASGSGKSMGAKLITTLLFGEEHLSNNTVAANYASASRDPVIVLENKEAKDLSSEELNFMITVATGIVRGKRKAGTESDTVRERGDCLLVVTAIEPFNISEIIDRIYDIDFDLSLGKPGFMESSVVKALKEKRNIILNGFFKLVSCLLRKMEQRRNYWFEYLSGKAHVKLRTNDFLAIMCVILEEIMSQCPELFSGDPYEIVDMWLESFDTITDETKEGTSTNLFLLDYVLDHLKKCNSSYYVPNNEEIRDGEFYSEAAGDVIKDSDGNVVGFVTSSKKLFAAFSMVAKQLSLSEDFRYRNPRQMGVRLYNDRLFLEKHGWFISHEKTVNGEDFKRYAKKL